MKAQLPDWPSLVCLVRIEHKTDLFRTNEENWNRRQETARHLCTRQLTAEQANALVHSHWDIKNSLQYVRDVTFAENACRIREKPGVFARLRSWTLNVMRGPGHHNIHATSRTFGWDEQAAWACLSSAWPEVNDPRLP
ncbi:MAG: hypothetical protein H7240_07925 [Glaciimonas sp.]|nr:hypothetical protein [Glaciimonas sp.]